MEPNAVEDLLKAAFQSQAEKDASSSLMQGANVVTSGHHVERVPFFAHETRVMQSFDDFSQQMHQKLLFSHHKYAAMSATQKQASSSSSSASSLLGLTTGDSAGVNKMTLCLLYELYGRPEIIAFLEALVPRVTTESLSPDSGVADICSKIVEPICTRLYETTERQQVPILLKVILRAIHRHHHHALHAEDYLSIILTPYVCNALVDNHVQRGLHMDPASQHIVSRVRDLLYACFDPHVGKKLQLSLSDSAALSRSRWFIARAMASLVEDDRPFPSSGIAKMVLSPVAQLAYMRPETNRPKALDSFICLKPSELLYMLKMFDLASIATSLLISSSRAVSESMSVLSSSDLVTKLSGYVITNANNASNVPAGGVTSTGGGIGGVGAVPTTSATITPAVASNRRTYLPTVLDRDVVYIFDLDESERDKDPLLDLLDDDDLVATGSDQVRNYFDLPVTTGSGNNGAGSGSGGGGVGGNGAGIGSVVGGSSSAVTAVNATPSAVGNTGLLLTTEEESAAANELQVINWWHSQVVSTMVRPSSP